MPVCSQCQNTIPAEDINVASDVAFCRPCNHVTKLSDLTEVPVPLMEFDPTNPPHGAWARGGPDNMELFASHRDLCGALIMLFPCVFWNSIVSVFLVFLISMTLNLLGVQVLPNWFPSDIAGSGALGGVILLMWLFLTPFVLVGLREFFLPVLNWLFGRTILRIGHSGGELFTGIGPFGWTRRFNALEVSDVRYERSTQGVLVFKDGKEIKFGLNCPPERLQFLVAGAKTTLRSLVGEELLDTYDNDSSDNERGVNVELGMAVPVAVAVPLKEQTNPMLLKASVRKCRVPQGGVYT
jgi:hypothetical protein